MSAARRLVLFDIDGTLLKCGPQVKALFAELLAEVFGTAGEVDAYDFAGKTDDQIVGEVLGAAGVTEEVIAAGLPRARALWAIAWRAASTATAWSCCPEWSTRSSDSPPTTR